MQSSLEELNRFSELLQKIYDGAMHPEVWPDVISQLADWFAARGAMLYTPLHGQREGGFFFTHGYEEGVMDLYRAKYQPHDVWVQTGVSRGLGWEGNILTDTDLVPEEEYRTSLFYREFASHVDVFRTITGIIFDGQTLPALPTICAFHRGERQPAYKQDERTRFGLLLPHLSRSFGMMYRLREADLRIAASLSALDRLSTGVLLIAPPGEVVFANRAATVLLEQEDGLRLQPLHGRSARRLLAAQAGTQSLLDEAIRQTMTNDILEIPHFSRSIHVRRPSGRSDYAIQLSMLTEKNEFGQGIATPRAIAFLADPSASVAPAQGPLIELYRLTPAEVRLAIALGNGDGLQEVAGQLGISLNTAKTQLQSIYGKTGTDSRAKLTKLLFALAKL
jgi:DNA-binding CsgD family transcriptional regulator